MLRKLQAKLETLRTEGSQLLNTAEAENRILTEDEDSRFREIEAELEQVQNEISQANLAAERRRNLEAVSSAGVVDTLPGLPVGNSRIEVGENRRHLDPTCGFSDMTEFAQSVFNAMPQNPNATIDDRLREMYATPANFHQESGSNDGYAVPPQFRDEIWSLVHQQDDLFSMIDADPTNSNQINDLHDESTPWGGTGVQAYWAAEANQMQRSRDQDKKPRSVKLEKLYAFVEASDELLQDAPRMQNRLTRKAAESISWKRDEAVVYGSGNGQPLGYFNSGALVSVPKESGQTADTIVAANLSRMFSRMLPVGISRSIWLANSDVLPQLMMMTIGDQPIWTPPQSGFQGAPGGFILGRPVKFSEHAKTLGDQGDVQFVDLMGYYGAVKSGGVQFASSIHLWFDYGLQAFRWTFRFGGQPHLSKPVAPNNGSATKSHFVVLDERA